MQTTLSEIVDDSGAAFTLDGFRTWYRTNLGFNPGGTTSSPTDLTALQLQIDNAEIIARSDTLQAGETISEAGEVHNYAGRAWISLNDDAVVPDPLTVAALEASDDFTEFTVTPAGEAELNLASTCFSICLLYTSPSPRDQRGSRMPSSA